ncbi:MULTISPECIES: hypothetical protein [Methylobacterium]|uniref:hypothetical protein n=1 Tax=Methylobacterium TaxID=407 RepID=UPI0010528803|nr:MULTISPECIES: hypothetical protein [Methylobacterium]MDR7039570.1 hypothetical protein [Methylobacterium sp. BE186]
MPTVPPPGSPPCAFMRELLSMLREGEGADALFLRLLMLELRALTCGASDDTLQAIVTARTAIGFATLGGLPGIARPA